ncbi:hypothetical protein C8J57DRAFT_1268463 [Mycena rebaudengoi]|nr:hypothetical protein C8J57DRAFT_1268463 [Mycena rebaudengoi]
MPDLKPPSHWPAEIRYISASVYHSSVPDVVRGTECRKTRDIASHPSLVAIRRITTSTHPACGQFGLFAARKIPAKEHIVDYFGEIHCEERKDSDYDLSLFRDPTLGINVGIDANKMGNESRFVNDYRGIQDKPNAVFVDRMASGELRIGIWSSRNIKKGEEILVSYGKGWWQARKMDLDGISGVE